MSKGTWGLVRYRLYSTYLNHGSFLGQFRDLFSQLLMNFFHPVSKVAVSRGHWKKIRLECFNCFNLIFEPNSNSQVASNCGWVLAEWSERLAVNAKVATVLGSIPASSDTDEAALNKKNPSFWIRYCEYGIDLQYFLLKSNMYVLNKATDLNSVQPTTYIVGIPVNKPEKNGYTTRL